MSGFDNGEESNEESLSIADIIRVMRRNNALRHNEVWHAEKLPRTEIVYSRCIL